MPVPEEEMIASTTDYLVTEHVFNPKASVAEVMAYVRACKSTGSTSVVTNQGGVRSIVATERTKMTEAESNAVRKAMGMDYEEEVDEVENTSTV